MLIGNGTLTCKNPMRHCAAASFHSREMGLQLLMGMRLNLQRGEATDANSMKIGIPEGYRHPACWVWPIQPGGLAARNLLVGDGSMGAANLAGGLNALSDIDGDATIFANLGLIVSAVAAITGSATVAGSILGVLQASAALTGAATVTAALGAMAGLIADLDGSTVCAGSITAIGWPSADLTVTGSTLTTANVADAIWGAVCEAGLTYEQCLRLINAVLHGKTDITGSVVTFRDVADTKDRVVATMTGSERTSVTRDAT